MRRESLRDRVRRVSKAVLELQRAAKRSTQSPDDSYLFGCMVDAATDLAESVRKLSRRKVEADVDK